MPKNAVKLIPYGAFDTAGLLANPQPMTFGLVLDHIPVPVFMIVLTNVSQVDVFINFNNDPEQMQYLRAEQTLILPFQTNNQPSGHVAILPANTSLWISGPVAGAGHIYCSGYYVEQS